MSEQPSAAPWTMAATEAKLFGAAVIEKRSEYEISLDGLSKDTSRTEAWFAAVERGELTLTSKMALCVGTAFMDRKKAFNVEKVVKEIRSKPAGPDAGRFRVLLQLNTPTSSSIEAPSERSVPELLSSSDRLLVLGPWLLLSALLYGVLQVLELSAGNGAGAARLLDATKHLSDVLGPIIVVGTVTAALGLRALEVLTRGVAEVLRTGSSSRTYARIEKVLTANGVQSWNPTSVHRADDIAEYLLPRYRQVLRTASLRAHFAERTVPAIAVSLIAAFASAVVAITNRDEGVSVVGPIAVTGFLLLLLLAAWQEADRSATDMRSAVCRGFGYVTDDGPALDALELAAIS